MQNPQIAHVNEATTDCAPPARAAPRRPIASDRSLAWRAHHEIHILQLSLDHERVELCVDFTIAATEDAGLICIQRQTFYFLGL